MGPRSHPNMPSVDTPAGAKTPASVTEQGDSRPTTGSCHMTVPDDAADNVIEREHPASDVEFAAVAVLATLAFETDTKGSALPPLWPMLLHFFSGFAVPTGTAAESLDASAIPQLIRALHSPIHRHQHEGAFGMRKVLSRDESPPFDDAIAAGAVPLLAKLLENDNTPVTQFEAAWSLGNIASGTTDHTACIVNTPGLISSFVRLLGSGDHNICEQTAWALGNIAGASPIYRDLLLERGVLTELAHIPERLGDRGIPLTLRRHMTWAISNLCRGTPAPPLSGVASALPYLAAMLQYPDSEVVTDAMWSLSYISDGTNDRISAVLAHGVLPGIMYHLLSGAGKPIETPALRCLGNIVSGDGHQTTLAVEHGAITVLCAMLRAQVPNPRVATKKEILWALSNIAAGNDQQNSALLQAGVFDLIANYIAIDDQSIRKEAQWTVANALEGASPADRTAIISSTSFRALLNAASSHRICLAGVEGIATALQRGFDAVAAIACPDELSTIVAALYEDKDPNVQQHARRIHAMIRGELADDVATDGGVSTTNGATE
jgi:importin subunit alpha-1